MRDSKSKLDISRALAAAACALLGNNSQAGVLDYDLGGSEWDSEAAFLFYTESDGRVSAVAPAIQLTRNIDTDEFQTFRLTVDSLTGASPSGAVPSNNAQTFTGPSGNNNYTIAGNQAPLDSSFKDTRVAFNAGWERPLGEQNTLTVGGNFSKEYDYISLGLNTRFARYFNQKNTTLSAGVSLASDTISAVGGTPLVFDNMPTVRDSQSDTQPERSGDQTKTVTDLLFGLTQIIDRDSVVQFSVGLSQSDGYQNDPYKVISVVDSNGDPVIADTASNLSLALYESRPARRARQSLYLQYKRNFNGSVLDTSYRYMQDDWKVRSHTLDFSYRMSVGSGGWLQPRFRFYTQDEAEFYTPYFRDGQQPSAGEDATYASSDYRLGPMDATTAGISYGRDGSRPWHVTLEYYLQTPSEPTDKFGALENLTLSPELKAVIFRFNVDL